MTDAAKSLLDTIKDDPLFKKHGFIFIGGTALSYHINHRISEDLDFAFTAELPIYDIKAFALRHKGIFMPDPRASVFRINRGIDIETRYIRYVIDDVKIEFFYPEDPVSQSCLSGDFTFYEMSDLHLLNVSDVARMKVKALMDRIKIRDLFDVNEILKRKILTESNFFEFAKTYTEKDEVTILERIGKIKEQPDDESLYFNDDKRIPSFDELKHALYERLDNFLKHELLCREKELSALLKV